MKEDKRVISLEEIEALRDSNNWDHDAWWIILLMLIFIGFGDHTDHQTREELAEVKGKVSILEQLAVADRRA